MSSSEIKYKLGMELGNVPQASAQARKSIEEIGKAGQISAAQTAAAMRTLPAQFTDIATQLQGGANPLTVLLQQGGQIKDSFGGIGPAIRALAGAITPTGVAITAITAAVGGLAYAANQAQQDSVNLSNALRLTNNSAGLTKDSFADLTASVAKSANVTKSSALEAAQAVAASGMFNRTTATEAAQAIAVYAKVTGKDVPDALKLMEEFTRDAAGTAAKLNERLHFLTSDTYAHIVALQEQGKSSEAAALAMSTLTDRMKEQQPELTTLGKIAQTAGRAWDSFWQAVKGPADTSANKIAGLQKAIDTNEASIQGMLNANKGAGSFGVDYRAEIAAARSRIAQFKAEIEAIQKAAQQAEEKAKSDEAADRKGVLATSAQNYFKQKDNQYSPASRLKEQMAEYDRMVKALEGTDQARSADEQARDRQRIREDNADKRALALRDATLSSQLALEKAASAARINLVDNEEARLAVARAAGLVSVDEYEKRRIEIQRKRLVERQSVLQDELRIEAARTPADEVGRVSQQAKLTGLRAQIAGVKAETDRLTLQAQAEADARALDEARRTAQEYAQIMQQATDMTQQLAAQSATGMAKMIVDPMERARAEAEIAVVALERNTERMRVLLQNQVDLLKGSADQARERGNLNEEQALRARAQSVQSQLSGLNEASKNAATGIRTGAEAGVVDDYIKKFDVGTNIANGFDQASASLATYVQTFARLVDEQKSYESTLKASGLTDEKRAQLAKTHAAAQIDGYAAMAASAKGFFAEGSKGYRALETAERAFRAIELANAIQAAATKMGLIGTVTTAKLAGDTTMATSDTARAGVEQGNSLATAAVKGVEAVINAIRSMPFPLNLAAGAATAAAVASLGVAITGGFGSSGGFAATNDGSGTVLGDSSAKSQSVTKSIEALKDVDTATMRYSAQMLESLKSIESNIGGLAALVVQSGGLSASAASVQTGFRRNGVGNLVAGINDGFGVYTKMLEMIPGIGGMLSGLTSAVGNFLGNLFGTKTSIQGNGIYAGGQSLGSIAANGFQAKYYTDIKETQKTLGITTGTSYYTRYSDADVQLERQIGTLFKGFATTLEEAAGPLGVSLDAVKGRISSFVVDIGRIDLQGLSGEQIQERLTSVFSAAGDRLASSALGGFESFQKVGEGYLQTVIRTATAVETADAALERLGVTAVSLSQVQNKQGDVAAELVRDSILATEGLNGISNILKTLDGSASDLASTYKSLTDVRTSLKLLGLDGAAVTRSLVVGANGIQGLTDALAAFEQGFLSQNNQIDVKAQRLALEFQKLGLSLPSSSAQYVSLVKGIDTSTEAGQKLLGSVLSLSGGFADLLSAIKDTGSGIADEIERIKGLSATSAAQNLAGLQASFAIKTAQARAGDQAAIDALPKISQALLDVAEATAASSVQYMSLQASTLASLQETLAQITDPTKRLGRIPGFASGGYHSGGLRIVGEVGAELEATGPARYYSAGQTAALLGGGDAALLAELQAVRKVLESLEQGQMDGFAAVAVHTKTTATILTNVAPDGDAVATRVAA